MLFSTAITPGACQAARSASARSAQDLTVPVSVTLEPTVSTVMLPASSSALRFKASFDLALDIARHDTRLQLDVIGGIAALIAALGFESPSVHDAEMSRIREGDHLLGPQRRERTAHRFNRNRQVVRNVVARHRQAH
jgi:hypothetical protein